MLLEDLMGRVEKVEEKMQYLSGNKSSDKVKMKEKKFIRKICWGCDSGRKHRTGYTVLH